MLDSLKDRLYEAVYGGVKPLVLGSVGSFGLLLAGCVSQQVTESIEDLSSVEGQRFAHEVAAQSPFEEMEIRWSGAQALMELRNQKFRAASRTYHLATEEKTPVNELTGEVKDVVVASLDDTFNADALVKSLQNPVSQLPKQFATLTKIKNLSHQVERQEWEQAAQVVESEFIMRQERVKLHRLLQMSELIEAELALANRAPVPTGESNPELRKAILVWRANLHEQRQQWLTDMRDLFDAEYYEVRTIRDAPGLPRYQDETQPDLTDWHRWCYLPRKQELVNLLGKTHRENKPTVPGTSLVTEKLADMVGMDRPQNTVTRNDDALRSEVRSLVKNWREMKKAQQKAERLEAAHEGKPIASVSDVKTRQKIFTHRRAEIEHAAVIWLMDEHCWR